MKKEPVRPDENADSRELVASLMHSQRNGRDAFSLPRVKVQKSIRLFSVEKRGTISNTINLN